MKKFFLSTLCLVFLSGFVFSQTETPLKYANEVTEQGLKKQLTIVASAEMEGRETGTEGQRKAAAYIESQFKGMGLMAPASLNNYQQFYPLFRDTLIPKSLKIGKQKLKYGEDYILQPGTEDVKKISAKQWIFAGYGIEDSAYTDYAGKDVKGKVVIIFSGEPQVNGKYVISGNENRSVWGFSVTKKAVLAHQKGAVAVVLINAAWDSIPTRLAENSIKSNLSFARSNEPIKSVVIMGTAATLKKIIGGDAAAPILAAVAGKEPLNNIQLNKKERTQLAYKRIRIKGEASNVIGYVEGSDKKDEFVFVTAHYDHLGKRGNVIYYGADDDGSGTVSVIEMARAFAKAKAEGHGPRRTVVFMTVSGEEKGLWGSEYYSDHPVFPMEKTTVDLNIDMIGRIDPNRKYGDSTNYVYVIGNDKLSSDLDFIHKTINDRFVNMELDYKFNAPDDPERIYFRSDHYNFARKGVPILFFFDGIHKDYHKPSDTVDKINFDLMEKRARFVFLLAWEMANRDSMLKRDIPLPDAVR